MKTMMYIRYLLIGLMSIFYLSACNDNNETFDFVGNEGCIYIREVSGSREFPVRTEIFTVPDRVFGKVEFKFPAHSTMPVKENVEVDLVIDNSLIESYNKEHNTTYASIDPQYLVVKNLKLTIAKGQTASTDSLSIVIPEEQFRKIENGQYMVPVRMEKVTGYLHATSLEENTAMYLIVSVLHSDSNVQPGDGDDGVPVPEEERKEWKAEYSAPYEISDYSGNGITDINQALFDRNSQTLLQPTVDFVEGDYLLVDLGKVYSNITSFFIQYSRFGWTHTQVIYYTSNDKETWIKQGVKDVSSTQSYCAFYTPVEARYVKVVGVALMYSGTYLYLGDFDVYLKK